jgi:hypothetical protein
MLMRLKIHHKMIISTLVILLVVTITLVALSLASIQSLGTRQLYAKGMSLGSLAAETLKPAVQYNVAEDVEKVLKQIVHSDKEVSVAALIVQGPKGDHAIVHKCQDIGYPSLTLKSARTSVTRPPDY